jgi:hypothetical protein
MFSLKNITNKLSLSEQSKKKETSVHCFKNATIIHEYDNTCLLKTNVQNIDFTKIVNWSKNRPPDQIRIKQILEHYNNCNITLIPGIIYMWKNPELETYSVYDGIHRLLAANEYKSDAILIFHILTSKNEQDIINDFLNINKSVSVPTIYLEETNVIKKLVCQNVADDLCRLYPTFVSPSRKPYVYNFNRDNLVEFISTLDIDFYKSGIDKYIINELKGINCEAKNYVFRHKIEYPKKCAYHDFYLFFLDKSVIKQKLENFLNKVI